MPRAQIRAPKPKDSTTTLTAATDPGNTAFIMFTAEVLGNPTPTGTITFKDGTTVIATISVDTTVSNVPLPATVTAYYNGDSKWNPSVSQTLKAPYV